MNNNKLGLIAASILAASSAQSLVVDSTTTDGDALTSAILGSGITVGSSTYVGDSNQSGFFSDGLSSGIGIDSGIILTTGNANQAAGPNTSDSMSVNTTSGGDADLSAQVGGASTNDTASLTFDFVSDGGDLFFNFVFASEEYNEYVNSSFNDTFGFFVDGVNVALAPDGQAVSVNNVNCGNPLAGAGPNCDSYNNNDISDGGPFFDIAYDGFTDVFTASVLGLSAGSHTMKFAIADVSDSSWDSAVFIQGGTFSDNPTPVPEPGSLALLGLGLIGLRMTRKRQA